MSGAVFLFGKKTSLLAQTLLLFFGLSKFGCHRNSVEKFMFLKDIGAFCTQCLDICVFAMLNKTDEIMDAFLIFLDSHKKIKTFIIYFTQTHLMQTQYIIVSEYHEQHTIFLIKVLVSFFINFCGCRKVCKNLNCV